MSHTYDSYGHEPGCPECYKQRQEAANRDRERIKDRETVRDQTIITVTYEAENGSGKHKIVKTLTYKKGQRFNAMSLAFQGQRAGYELQDLLK